MAEVAELKEELNEGQFDFLAQLTVYCIEARYGDYKESLSEIINKEKAEEVYDKTLDIFKWLFQKMN